MFEKIEGAGGQIVNLYRVLAHSPEICRAFIRFGNRLLFKGALPPKLRELAILLVSERTDSHYERSKHREIAVSVGVPQSQVDAVKTWFDSDGFDEKERAVLQYADEVIRDVRAAPETFEALRPHFNEEAIVELTTVIGFYCMVSRILENLQVELEEGDAPPM
jgi:alkylhydroperoxidase family enzyme